MLSSRTVKTSPSNWTPVSTVTTRGRSACAKQRDGRRKAEQNAISCLRFGWFLTEVGIVRDLMISVVRIRGGIEGVRILVAENWVMGIGFCFQCFCAQNGSSTKILIQSNFVSPKKL